MSDELSELNLQDDFQEALNCEDSGNWKLEKSGPLEVWVTLSSAKAPKEIFQARLLWQKYPEYPSLKFRDLSSGRIDLSTAWPVVRGFRPTSLDACVSWCLEGFKLHPEWKNDARYKLDPNDNVLLKVTRILKMEMDDHYQGRFKG